MSVTQIIRGDSSGAVKAVQDLNKALDKTEQNLQLNKREAKALEAQAKKIAEAVDPLKKYTRQMEDLAKAVKTGHLSLADAEKQALRYRTALEKVGKGGNDAFGGPMLSRLASMASGVLSLTAVVGALTKAFTDAEAAAQGAADAAFSSLGQQGELQQLTDDPKKLGKINAYAKDLVRRGIFLPSERAQAFETAFELESAGYSDADKELFAEVGDRGLVKGAGLVNLGGYVRKAQRTFGLPEDSTASVLDKLIQTAATAQASLSETAGAVPEFGTEAKAAGISFDEALAGFLGVEYRSKGPEEAAVRFKNFLGMANKKGMIENGSLSGSLAAMQRQVEGGRSEFDMFNEIRARAGFRAVRDAYLTGEVEKQTAITANASGLAERRGGLLEDVDPVYAAAKLRRRAEGSLADFRERNYAEKENLTDAILAEQRRADEAGYGPVLAAIESLSDSIYDWLGAEEVLLRRASENKNGVFSSETQQKAQDFLRRSAEAAERTADGIEQIKGKKPATGRRE